MRRFGWDADTRAGLMVQVLRRERRMHVRSWLSGLVHDAVASVRAAVRDPGMSLVIVVTLALGLAANAIMFGLIDRLLLRGPAHVQASEDLYRFYLGARSSDGAATSGLGYVSYLTFRDGTRSFDGVAAYAAGRATLGRGTSAEPVSMAAATSDFFPLLGVSAFLGRFPNAEEDLPPTGADVIVLGHDLWLRRYGGDPAVLGRTVTFNDASYTVIGVAPAAFTGVELAPVDVWIPMTAYSRNVTSSWTSSWNAQWLRVVGRLRQGVTREQADIDATSAHRAAYTGESERVREARAVLRPIYFDRTGNEPLEVVVSRWLLAVTGVVLLIVCANVMNLLLARSTRRRREVAVRLALGIGQARLIRLLVMHGIFLAVAGGGLALLLVAAVGGGVRTFLLPDLDWSGAVVDARMLLFTAAVVLLTAMFTSLLPAVRAGRRDLTRELRSGIREGGGRRSLLRDTLTLAQITLTFVLLIAAGLFARSLATVQSLDLGIDVDRVLTLSARLPDSPPADDADPADRQAAARERSNLFYNRALERVSALPGVGSAAVAVGTPFRSSFTIDVRASGHDSIPALAGGGPYIAAVTDGFFETTGIALLEGRAFTAGDATGDRVAIVNRTMASALWPNGALGECLYLIEGDQNAPCSRVVGVVEDARRFGLREAPAMQYYVPKGQETGFSGPLLLVRPAGPVDDPGLPGALRSALFELDPTIAYVRFGRLQDEIDPQVRPWKLGAMLFSAFGGLALLIAVIGLYSVIAYMVADRTHELGVRKALGAERRALLSLVMRRGAVLAATGLLLGAAIALTAARYIQPALFDTSARDPVVYTIVALVTLGAALLASLLPAVRAGRVDPVVALRTE